MPAFSKYIIFNGAIKRLIVLLKTGMKTFLLILITILSSCNNTSQEISNIDSTTVKNDSIATGADTAANIDTINNSEVNDSIIRIKFARDSISTTVSGKMKGINHRITVYIPIEQGRQLTASLATDDSVANIRFNQIFTPDGKADGPFGKDLKHAIQQRGMYKLIIAENLMQADEWKGKFKLTVKVE